MTTPNPISSHAAKAVTRLIGECHMMEFCDADAERIVQDAIDAAKADAAQAAKEAEVPQRAPAPAEQMDALKELAERVGQ